MKKRPSQLRAAFLTSETVPCHGALARASKCVAGAKTKHAARSCGQIEGTHMLEASRFTPQMKKTLNASRHQRALAEIAALEGQISRTEQRMLSGSSALPIEKLESVGSAFDDIIAIAAALPVAMATAPDGAKRHELWIKYVRWQQKLARYEDRILGFLLPPPEVEIDHATGYPVDWPSCPGCGVPVLDGHMTCGNACCGEASRRSDRA